MAYTKKKKKFHVETPEEKAQVEEKLNASKKWNKPYKGEIVYEREGTAQLYVRRSRYFTKDELAEDAKKIIGEMSAIDTHKWKLISASLVGQAIDDEDAS